MSPSFTPHKCSCYIAGRQAGEGQRIGVFYPYDASLAGEVQGVNAHEVEEALAGTGRDRGSLTRFERSAILQKTASVLEERQENFAHLITRESGLCLRETRYEVGRSLDVLKFSAMEALRDDGQIFSCDISQQGKARKIFTMREPLGLALAITPFNHPLNQVVHKVAPAIAAGTPLILKPSERTPLTAIRFAELLYECGLPGSYLSVLLGPHQEVTQKLITDPRVELVSFTGSVSVGKKIAQTAGYKRLVLELGGNDPLLVLEDANLDLAVQLAAEGSFRNSGQRCTAVKRILVHRNILDAFTDRFLAMAAEYMYGDPFDPTTRVGTVINEESAAALEDRIRQAQAAGAQLRFGGDRDRALLAPTVLTHVPRDAELVACESFGPVAPVIGVEDLDDAIACANGTSYGLSSGVVTQNMNAAIRCIKELRAGTVNVNEVPGYRLESSPFGGIKDSGLGIKEGVIEAMKMLTYVKTFSLPW